MLEFTVSDGDWALDASDDGWIICYTVRFKDTRLEELAIATQARNVHGDDLERSYG